MNCGDCVHAYDSADNKLRCRIHPRGLVCNQAMFDDCKRFILNNDDASYSFRCFGEKTNATVY